MVIGATGIVVDHYGDVLLIQRDDTRTLAPPGGSADIGEIPPDTAVREVREETGLIVQAVRLVGIYYLPTRPNDYLTFVFRCIMRGGEITTSEESPQAGFFKTNPLPKPMLDLHQERIERSLAHRGGPPYWGSIRRSGRLRLGNALLNRLIYPWLQFRRRRAGLPAYEAPPAWQVRNRVIIRNDQEQILWVWDQARQNWILPGGVSAAQEPPWEAAVRSVKSATGLRVRLDDLSGAYPAAESAQITFVFEGAVVEKQDVSSQVKTDFFTAGHEPSDALPQHVTLAADAGQQDQGVHFRLLPDATEQLANLDKR